MERLKNYLANIFTERGRIQWMEGRITEGFRTGLLTEPQAEILKGQLREERMQGYIKDLLLVTPACTVLTLPVQPILYFLIGDIRLNVLVAASPISQGGVLRSCYVIARGLADIPEAVREKSLKPLKSRFAGLPIAPIGWGPLGLTFTLPQIATYYPETAEFLSNYLLNRAKLRTRTK